MATERDNPKLLILTSSFPRGPGDETCGYIRDFARSLSDRFTVTVLAPPDQQASPWPSDGFRLCRSRSMLPRRVDPFKASDDLGLIADKGLLTGLAALVSVVCFFARALWLAIRADVICSHWLLPCGLIGSLLSRGLRKPHLIIEHSGALHLLARMPAGDRAAGFVVNRADRIVTVSNDLKRKLSALCPGSGNKTDVIPMGLTRNGLRGNVRTGGSFHLQQSSESQARILFLGRLARIKGVDVLLRAVSRLEGVELSIAGDGDWRSRLERLALDLGVSAKFLGRVGGGQRAELLTAADVLVVPSLVLPDGRTEGTPVVCLEAMVAGCAVVASRAGGLAEIIIDGENGLLFDAGDDEMLAEKLALLLSDRALRQRISAAAHLTAAGYDWSNVGLQFCEVLEGLLAKNDRIGCDQRVGLGPA